MQHLGIDSAYKPSCAQLAYVEIKASGEVGKVWHYVLR